MSTAAFAAGLAAALAVWGVWEGLVAVEALAPARRLAALTRPLALAGSVGREPTTPERRRLAVLGSGAVAATGWLVGGPVGAVVCGAGAPMALTQLVAARRRRWRRRLAAAVPTVARSLADALAGGRSVRGALEAVAAGGALSGPAQRELAAVARRLALGEPTEPVLEALRCRARDPAWDTVVAAILLQREAGGDLAGLLRSVAVARERARREEADARGLTAQARATARLVAGLPFVGLGLGELAAPGTIAALLDDPRSRILLLLAGFAVGIAVAVVGRLARVPAA